MIQGKRRNRTSSTWVRSTERAGIANCPPKLNPKGDPNKHLSYKGAPWKMQANEKPKGETINYDKLLGAWKEGKVR